MGLKSFLLNLLFPLHCLGCGREGFWLCPACFKKIKFSGQDKSHNLNAPTLNKIFVAGDYDDPLLAVAIKSFKYDFKIDLGAILARFLILFWAGQVTLTENINKQNNHFLLIPIPLSKKRRRWRGFNQAEILARALSAHFAYPLNLQLKRDKQRRPQAGLSESERGENIKNIFRWRGADLQGRSILLIDDVVTTGATLNEAARVLKEAGAEKIYGLVLAKG